MKLYQYLWARNLWVRNSTLLAILFLALSASTTTNALTAIADPAIADTDILLSGSPSLRSALLVLDFDKDGTPEIALIGEDGILYLISGVTNQILWEKNVAEYTGRYSRVTVEAGLSAGDLDNDGRIELIVATGGLPVSASKPGAMLVLTYVGGNNRFALMSGWPQFPFDELGNPSAGNRPDGTPDGFVATPAIGDVDGDGDKEIVVGGMDRRIHVWHHTGDYVNGWPFDRDNNHYRDTLSSAALADLDNDGDSEIIVGTNNYKIPACPNPYYFYVLNGDATFFPGWPVETTQNIASSPAVGDLDGDGFLDIVVGTGTYNERCGQQPDGKKVYAWDRNGKALPGWPKATAGNMESSPALGDLDGDGNLDVVIACNDQLDRSCNTIYAWRGNGQALAGWPVQSSQPFGSNFPIWDSPRIADIDGDGAVEVLIADSHTVLVIGPDGQYEQLGRRSANLYLPPGIAIADIDEDGLFETMVVGKDPSANKGVLLIWQEDGAATGKAPWPNFHRDAQRSGLLPTLSSIAGRVTDPQGKGLTEVTIQAGDQTTTTDANGNYLFVDLPPGQYTLTASHPQFELEPSERVVQLPPSRSGQDFVQVPEKLTGYVLQSNSLGLADVTVVLNTNAQSTTNNDGYFEFDNLEQKRYVVAPSSDQWRFLPAEAAVSLPTERSVSFIALANAVETSLTEPGNYTLEYFDTQNLPTTLNAESDTDNASLRLTPTMPTTYDEDAFAAHAFEIALIESSLSSATAHTPLALQLSVEIQYSNDDVRIVSDESQLTLRKWNGETWQELQEACDQGTQTLSTTTNRLTATLCDVGTYALWGPTERVLLPIVQR